MAASPYSRPSDRQTVGALRTVACALGLHCASVVGGTYYFIVSDEWALAVRPDDAGRFRVTACYGRSDVATLWAQADDRSRLADLAREFKAEIEALRS